MSEANVTQLPTGGEGGYTIRALKDGDTFKVGAMIAKVMGDEKLQWAGGTGNETMMLMAGAGALMEHAPRDLQLLCANLIGIERDFDEYKARAKEEHARQLRAVEEQRQRAREAGKTIAQLDEDPVVAEPVPSDAEIRTRMDDDIIREYEQYPPGTTQEILSEVMERDDFVPFITSSMRLSTVARGLRGRFSTPSEKKGSGRKRS